MPKSDEVPGQPRFRRRLAAGSRWADVVEPGEVLRVVDCEGRQGVDLLCFNADDLSERYNAPNTIKAAGTILIGQGTVLYSDRARALLTVVADTCGGHDTIAGCCSSWSNKLLYGVDDMPGCRENFLAALEPHGLGWRDIVPNVNLFCRVPVFEGGALAEGVFVDGGSAAGDFVDLRADRRTLVALSNCPQVNNPCNGGNPTPVDVIVYRPDPD